MKLKKIGLLLAIPLTLLLTGCGNKNYVEYETMYDSINQLYMTTHVSITTNDETFVYDFVNKTVTDTTKGWTFYVDRQYSEDEKYILAYINENKFYSERFHQIYLDEIERRGCERVYGCKGAQKQLNDKVADFKAQIIALEESAADMQAELVALTERETALQQQLTVAQSQEQQNADTIVNLEQALNDAGAQKQAVAENLAQFQALAETVLNKTGGE